MATFNRGRLDTRGQKAYGQQPKTETW